MKAKTPTKNESFQTKDVCSIVGIKPRQLILWSEKNIITPDIKKAKGKHSKRLFSSRNLLQAAIIKELASWNIELRKVKEITSRLDMRGDGHVRESKSRNSYITIQTEKIKKLLFESLVSYNAKKKN